MSRAEGRRKSEKEVLSHSVTHLIEARRGAQIEELLESFALGASRPTKAKLPIVIAFSLAKDVRLTDPNDSLKAAQERIEGIRFAENCHPLSNLIGVEGKGGFTANGVTLGSFSCQEIFKRHALWAVRELWERIPLPSGLNSLLPAVGAKKSRIEIAGMMEQAPPRLREVQAKDRAALLRLCRERPYPRSLFMGEDDMREVVSKHLDELFGGALKPPNLLAKVLVDGEDEVVGFLLLEVNQVESITKQLQTAMCDYHARDQEEFAILVEGARLEAASRNNEYLVVSNFTDFGERVAWLEACSFRPELLRVARAILAEHGAAEHPNYRVRKAGDNDMLFIMRLVAGHSPIYCPAHRPVDKEKIQQGFLMAYTTISPRDKKRVPLIIEDKTSGEPLGYIILEPGRVLGGDRRLTLYIYDIAVDSEVPVRGLSRYLCGGGEKLLARMGGGVFYGDISADNELALGAQRGLGFEVDSVRWGVKIV